MNNKTTATESEFWSRFCINCIHPAPLSSVASNEFCRRMLTQAATSRTPLGRDGWMWTFGDQSRIAANSLGVVVQ